MGYVNESQISTPEYLEIYNIRESDGFRRVVDPAFLLSRSSKTQHGYRSGPIVGEELKSIEFLNSNGLAINSAQQIDALERIQKATTPQPAARVAGFVDHDRTYQEIQYSPARASFRSSYAAGSVLSYYQWNGALVVTAAPPMTMPDVASQQGMAGSAMRSYAPTRPDFQLTRFVGELRDANRLFRPDGYVPTSLSGTGNSFLHYNFGVMPTVSDIQTGAEAIVQSDKKFGQFVRDSARLIHRRSRRVLGEDVNTITYAYISGRGPTTYSANGATVKAYTGMTAFGQLGPSMALRVHRRLELRTSSVFEYFVGDPSGFVTRQDSYVAKARKMLGGGLTLSTAYDLSKFSWMVDWFVDIGGLLAYQQQVADHSLVQRRGSSTVESISTSSAEYRPTINSGDNKNYSDFSGLASGIHKTSRRVVGGAYGMKPDLSLNGFQWAVLGSLGMTRGPGRQILDN